MQRPIFKATQRGVLVAMKMVCGGQNPIYTTRNRMSLPAEGGVSDSRVTPPGLEKLIPPDDLIISNGIGVDDKNNVAAEFHSIGDHLINEMISDGSIRPGHRVLDVGCGLGRTARILTEFLDAQGSYVGLDVNKSSIEWCQDAYKDYPNFSFIHMDFFNTSYNPTSQHKAEICRFPLEDGTIDFAYSTSLFIHVTLPVVQRYLAEINRVLKPDGTTWNTFFLLDGISDALAEHRDPRRPNVHMPHLSHGGRIAILDNPEALISFYTPVIQKLHLVSGLRIREIRNGPWSGRTDNLRALFQDVIVADKIGQMSLQQQDREIRQFLDALEAAYAVEAKKLHDEVEKLHARCNEVEGSRTALQERLQSLQQKQLHLRQTLSDHIAQEEQLQATLMAQLREIVAAKEQLQGIQRSRSWRITSPLRAATVLYRRIVGR
jgi:SAM-dependent methyltransferase